MDNNVDLYLWVEPKRDVLYKLGNITIIDANDYAVQWFTASTGHDYMMALIGSTPWTEPKPTIIDISPEWILEKIKEVVS